MLATGEISTTRDSLRSRTFFDGLPSSASALYSSHAPSECAMIVTFLYFRICALTMSSISLVCFV